MLTRLALVALVAASCLMHPPRARAAADDFYKVTDADLAGPPGSLIRILGMPKIQITGAMVYRILYRSTGLKGETIAVSGIVIAPDRTPTDPRGWPVVAWAHPTTGIARHCAPSLMPNPVAMIPGVDQMIRQRFVIVATDYPGMGGPGVHPYLVGESEARAVLDSVRAAREMREARASEYFTVWGHSQGGHAAIWTGLIAAKYAPELKLLGVAAAAPATELATLFEDDLTTLAGRILGGLVVDSWSKVFGAPVDGVVTAAELPPLKQLADDCIDLPAGEVGDLAANNNLPKQFLKADPTKTEPWKKLIAANTPAAKSGAPVFIAQGTADTVVDPPVTVDFAGKLCEAGVAVTFVEYAKVTHTDIAKRSAKQAVDWMTDRLSGKPAPSTCK